LPSDHEHFKKAIKKCFNVLLNITHLIVYGMFLKWILNYNSGEKFEHLKSVNLSSLFVIVNVYCYRKKLHLVFKHFVKFVFIMLLKEFEYGICTTIEDLPGIL
jgi:hypothetical protein